MSIIPYNGDLFGHHPSHDGQGLYRPVHRRAGAMFSSGCWESQVKLPLHIFIKQKTAFCCFGLEEGKIQNQTKKTQRHR